MAACIVEDVSTATSIYCQTTNTMERAPSSALETSTRTSPTTTTNSDHHRCSFNFHTNNILINQESTKKRQLSQNDTCNTTSELSRTVTDNSCRSQAVSINKNNESMRKTIFFKWTYDPLSL
jgi:hypothetical protein